MQHPLAIARRRTGLRIATAVAGIALVSACAGPGPDGTSIGSGSYLQVHNGTTTVLEMETAIAGMSSCTEQAHLWVRETPSLAGRVTCVGTPTTDPLPFSLRLHSTQGPSAGYYLAAPYRVRTSTSALCQALARSVRSGGTTAVLEDRCQG